MVDISIVSTLYKSESYIKEFYQRSLISTELLFQNIEFIFVNDGSEDLSSEIVKDICNKDSRVTLIDLSRNFGHESNYDWATACERRYVWLIDVDLEDQPEWMVIFIKNLLRIILMLFMGFSKEERRNV